jgi:hypothetical protein
MRVRICSALCRFIALIARKRQIAPGLPPEWIVSNEEINKQDEELALMSTHGRFIYAENSAHAIADDEPQVVINAIHEVVEALSEESQSQPAKDNMSPADRSSH